MDRNKYMICNIAYMENYDGTDTEMYNGGSFVEKNNDCCELYNFYSHEDGYYRQFVKPTDFTIDIHTNFNAPRDKNYIDGILVIWTATPKQGGKRLIAWSKNARVYKSLVEDQYQCNFNIKAKIGDCVLLNESERLDSVRVNKATTSNVWYASKEKDKPIVKELLKYIENYHN